MKSNVASLALNAFVLVALGTDHCLPVGAFALVNDAEGSGIEMISAIAAGADGTLIGRATNARCSVPICAVTFVFHAECRWGAVVARLAGPTNTVDITVLCT